jgi:hypothetical protein
MERKKEVSYIDVIEKESYIIMKYNKSYLSVDLQRHYGILRSLVFDSSTKRLLSFAPPKMIPYDVFTKILYTEEVISKDVNQIGVEEWIEGIEVQLFWDPHKGVIGGWEMNLTDNISSIKIKEYKKQFKETVLNVLQYNTLNPQFCYTFLYNVTSGGQKTKTEDLVLIDVYEIVHNNTKEIEVFPRDREKEIFRINQTHIRLPFAYPFTNYREIEWKYASLNTTDPTRKGFILRDRITNNCTAYMNPVYKYVKNPILQVDDAYLYFHLRRKKGQWREYIEIYPHKKKLWMLYREILYKYTQQLYDNYRVEYIYKNTNINNCIPKHFRARTKDLHRLYREIWKHRGECVTKRKVIDYVNSMNPSILYNNIVCCVLKM